MTKALHGSIEGGDEIEVDVTKAKGRKMCDGQAEQLVDVMYQCHWIRKKQCEPTQGTTVENKLPCPEPTASQLKAWVASIKQQENKATARRRNAGSVAEQVEVNRMEMLTETITFSMPLVDPPTPDHAYVPATETMRQGHESSSVAKSVPAIAEEFGLNEKQKTVYDIVARKFVDQHILKTNNDGKPLRMLMTGPGGTGKTHAVKALQKLMMPHNMQHLIRFLSPTVSWRASHLRGDRFRPITRGMWRGFDGPQGEHSRESGPSSVGA